MVARREQFVNDATTTLNGAINGSVTSITVTDGSVFPAEGDARLIIEDEIVLMTSRATNVLTVLRGREFTTAVSHVDTSAIKAIMTASQISQFVDDSWSGSTGRKPYRLLDINGNTLNLSSFTIINQGTSSFSNDASGGITGIINEITGDLKVLHKTAPTPPYILTAHFMFGPGAQYASQGSVMGVGGRESSTGELMFATFETGGTADGLKYNSPSSFNSFWTGNVAVNIDYDQVWLQWEDDNTDVFARVSTDGVNFFQIATEGRTSFMAGGADQIIWLISPRSLSIGVDKPMHLRSWIEE